MTNYGIKFNEKDRTAKELEVLTYRTPEQIKAAATLRFLRDGRPSTKNSDPIDPIPGAPARWPWESRTPEPYVEDVPDKPRWLAELLNEVPTPWYRRLWRWLDPRKQFRDWDRDDRFCGNCDTKLDPWMASCPECHYMGRRVTH